MNLLMWLKEPGARGVIFAKIYDEDHEVAKQALDTTRAKGWLTDGSMRGADLSEANLPNADLSQADLEEANLSDADLQAANLEGANLTWANLNSANLQNAILRDAVLFEANLVETDLSGANLTGTDLREAVLDETNLQGATVRDEQLAQCALLAESTMPDGTRYDGRFRLELDLKKAREGRRDLDSAFDMAAWYGVSIEDYERGQAWADQHLAAILERIEIKADAETPLIVHEVIEGEDEVVDEDSEITFASGRFNDYIDLIITAFEDPKLLSDYRKLGWNRDDLLLMGAAIAAFLLWVPALANIITYTFITLLTGERDSRFSAISTGLDLPVFLLVVLVGVIVLVLDLAAYLLTSWSLSRRKAHLGTHLAHILIFLSAIRSASGPFWFVPYFSGFVLAYVTLQAVGTKRSRHIISIIASLALINLTPLRLIWLHFIEPYLFYEGILSRDLLISSTERVQYLLAGGLWAVVEGFVFIHVVRSLLKNWVMPHLGTQAAERAALILLIIYGAGSFLAIFWSVILPVIQNLLS